MPLDKFVLILVCVAAAAGVTVWIATMVAAAVQFPFPGWLILVPVALIGYVIWRVVADRIGSEEDDHYDNIDR